MGGDLGKRVWFTLGALLVYRLGTYLPIPGLALTGHLHLCSIPGTIYEHCDRMPYGLPGLFDALTGGALGRISIFALSVLPYLAAAAVMLLAAAAWPALRALAEDGGTGPRKVQQYTRYLTVLLSALQAYGLALVIEDLRGFWGFSLVSEPGPLFRLTTVLTLTAGSLFVTCLAEQISRRGIGNGVLLILFCGLAVHLPTDLRNLAEASRTGVLSSGAIVGFLLALAGAVAFIVFMERAQRRVIVQYPKRQVGSKMFGGESSHLPLKLNSAGVIPPIFASSLLLMPLTVAGFSGGGGPDWLTQLTALLGHGQPLYLAIYMAMIVFFCFFYTSIVFNPADTADNLKKHGGFIPGIRPGANTAEYLNYLQVRLTVVGSAYLALVCLLPELLIAEYAVPFYFGGTSLLIVTWVILDLTECLRAQLRPPPGGPPDDLSGAVGVRVAAGGSTRVTEVVGSQSSVIEESSAST